MTTYIIILSIVLIFGYGVASSKINNGSTHTLMTKYSQKGRICVFFVALTLSVFAGFRWYLGTDYGAYFRMYYNITQSGFAQSLLDEPGISAVAKIGKFFYDSPISMFFLAAALTIFLYTYAIAKNTDDFLFSILLYIFIGAWHGAFNGMRQYLAAAVLFSGHRYLREKHFIRWCFVVAVAMLFHRTAIIMLPVYFVVGERITTKSVILIIVAVLVVRYSYDYLLGIMSFFKGNDQSLYSYMTSDVSIFRVLVAFAPLLLIGLTNRFMKQQEESQFYSMMLIINAGFMFGTSGSAYLARAGIFTEMYVALGVPKLMDCFSGNSRTIAKLVILCLYCIFWIIELNARGLIPFRWAFGQIG